MKVFSEQHVRENVKIKIFNKDGTVRKQFKPNWFSKLTGLKIGKWVEERSYANIITNAGLAAAAARLINYESVAGVTYIALGSGSTAEAATDTALVTELTTNGTARKAGTASITTTTIANDTASLSATFSITGAVTVEETGTFNASSAGTMLNRKVVGPYTLGDGDSVLVTHEIKFARA